MRARSALGRFVPLGILAVLLLSAFAAGIRPAFAFSTGEAASTVIGEPDYATGVNPNVALKTPSNFVFDSSGDIWIADSGNNRIIEESPPSPGASNTFLDVLGQASYSTGLGSTTATGIYNPSGMTFDSSGNLWVADTDNNRVLEFTKPFTMGEAASLVIGQPSFTTSAESSSPTGLYIPGDVLFDSKGDLWVVDGGNNRVLEYTAPFSTGMAPTLVIGQPDTNSSSPGETASGLYYPTYAAFDSSGNLWVADSENSRVLEFKAPFSTGMSASLVIGQSSLTQDSPGTSASALYFPDGIAFDSTGNLWVSDGFNDRVLKFTAPLTTGESASLVLGQSSYTASGQGLSSSTFDIPGQIAFDSKGDLWVADAYNNRLVEFAPPFSSGASASWVVGQTSYGSSVLQGQESLFGPEALAFDSSGDLWTVDTENSRVVEYTSPLSTGMSASLAIGQTNLTRGIQTTTPNGLDFPAGIAFDSVGDLWVADSSNNRVLEYLPPFTTGENASVVIGQVNAYSSFPVAGPSGFDDPSGIAFDSHGDLWVTDTENNRILEFKPPFTTDMEASLVIGQASFGTDGSGASANALDGPTSIAFDSSGNLWVADAFNDRVLEFTAPFTSGMSASAVVGQTTLVSYLPSTTASGLDLPTNIAFDKSGDLWVSDSGNNRVEEFAKPVSTGESASLVIGQGSFTSSALGTSATSFAEPLGIAFDPSGNLWVTDEANNRVLEFGAGSGGTTTSTTSTSSSSTTSSTTTSVTSVTTTSSSTTTPTTTTTTTSSPGGVTTLSVTTVTTVFNTTTTATSTTSTKSSTSTVPEFPDGPVVVLATAMAASLVLVSRVARGRARYPGDA